MATRKILVDQFGDTLSSAVPVTDAAPLPVAVSNGTQVADTVAGDAGQNQLIVAGGRKEVAFTTTTVQAVAATDCSNFAHVSVDINTQGGSSTVTFQCSDDNVNWRSQVLAVSTGTSSGPAASSTLASTMYHGPIAGRYFRLNVSGIVSGTTAGTCQFFTHARALNSIGAIVSVNGGQVAHAAAISGNPVREAGRARTSNYVAVANDQTADYVTTAVGAQVIKPYSIPEADWSYAAASGGIVNTADNALIAAAGAGIRNYLTALSIQNSHATVSTEIVVKDGASTVIWRGYAAAGSNPANNIDITFPTPLKSTAATALNVACITTGSAVYVNAQGYQAP